MEAIFVGGSKHGHREPLAEVLDSIDVPLAAGSSERYEKQEVAWEGREVTQVHYRVWAMPVEEFNATVKDLSQAI